MKTRMKRIMAVIAVAMLTLSTAAAYAHEGPKAGGKGEAQCERGDKFEKISEELGLSAEQKEQLKKEREANLAKTKELREKIQTARKDLKAELEKPTLDMARVNSLAADLKTLVGQQIQYRVDKVMSMRKILTPEQFKKMQGLIEEKKEGFKSKHGRMGRMPGKRCDRS